MKIPLLCFLKLTQGFLGIFWNALWFHHPLSTSAGILAERWVSKSTRRCWIDSDTIPTGTKLLWLLQGPAGKAQLQAQHWALELVVCVLEIFSGCDPCPGCSLSIFETMIRACASVRVFEVPRDISKQICKLKHCLIKQIGLNFIEAVIFFSNICKICKYLIKKYSSAPFKGHVATTKIFFFLARYSHL